MYECISLHANICSCEDEIIIVEVKQIISINKVSQMYNGCLLTAYKVFVCLFIYNIYFYWCNLPTHVVSMIILRQSDITYVKRFYMKKEEEKERT